MKQRSSIGTFERLRDGVAKHGDVFSMYSESRRGFIHFINDPEAVKRVLVTDHRNYSKGVGTDLISVLLGHGIMTSEGALWRRQRRMLQPLFHRAVINRFGAMICWKNRQYADCWAEAARDHQPLDIADAVSALTLDINLRTLLGRDIAEIEQRSSGNPFLIMHTERDRGMRFVFKVRALGKILHELIELRRERPTGDIDFLGLITAARDHDTREPMNEAQIIDEMLTLLVAGHETTAAALAWVWYFLGRHQDVQEALAASAPELPRGSFQLEELEQWPLGQQVIQECLRLCPPGWLLSRLCREPSTLCGASLDAGSNILVSPYFMHRHRAYWSDPDRFDPSRFAEAMHHKRPRFAYFPFGAGPRHCIGESLAMYELAAHLAIMSRRFQWELVSPEAPAVQARVNYRMQSGCLIRCRER